MAKPRQFPHATKSSWTEDEYARLKEEARARKLPLGPCVRVIVNDYLRQQLSREGTLLLEGMAELQANHLDVLRKTLVRQLSPQTLEELAARNRLRRRELVREFLGPIESDTDAGDNDEYEEEEED